MGTMLAINGNIINSQEPLPIPVDFMTKLWENPDPTSDFAQQQITLSEDATNYEFLMVELKYLKSADYRYNVIGHTGNNIILSYGECGSKGTQVTQRNLYLVSGYPNKVLINNCELAVGSTASTTSNDHCIPLAIYGFNTKVPMNNVSTGPTLLGSVTSDGVKTYSQLLDALFTACANTNDNSYVKIDTGSYTYVFRLSSKDPASYRFCSTWGVSGTKTRTETFKIASSGSVYYKQTDGTTVDGSSTVVDADVKFEVYNL